MNGRGIIGSVFWAAVLGVLIALPLGQRQQISVEIWMIAVSLWLSLMAVTNLLGTAPLAAGRLRALWERRGETEADGPKIPRSLQALEGTMISATDNERAYNLRLRPRLMRVTDHHLRSHHGIDPDRNPDRARAALGELWWMVDPAIDDRTPTADEIGQLIDLITETSN